MATASKTPNKTSFVKAFLKNHPQGNVAAVNEAWTAAGMNGTIGASLIQDMRAQMGLAGNLRPQSKPTAGAKAVPAKKPSKPIVNQGKASFVKEFLQKNPRSNNRAVNEAWTAAGMKGTISHPVISRGRQALGLINQPRKPKKRAQTKVAARISKPVVNPGKSMFVKEFLIDNPQGNVAAVNEAWRAGGFDGKISDTLVNKMRASLGLAGNLRGTTKKPAVTETPRKESAAAVKAQSQGNGVMVLHDLEAEIDRLMFKVMGMGNLSEIEDSLRQARRLLYTVLNRS